MISVVMATYNGEKYILEQLNSIWNQTQRPDEIIISDDHSSDRTITVVQKFAESTSAPIILLQNQNRVGYTHNFFRALKIARGDIVFLSDQDDIWDRKKIKSCCRIMEENPEILALSTGYFVINEAGKIIKGKFHFGRKEQISFKSFLRHPKYPGMAMAVRRELILEALTSQSAEAAHDWQLNQIAARKEGLFYWAIPLTYYRQHGNNTVGMTQFNGAGKARQRRVSMLQSLLDNLDTLKGVTPAELKFIRRLKSVLRNRMALLDKGSGFVLFYDLLNLKYVSLRSLAGDAFCVFNLMGLI